MERADRERAAYDEGDVWAQSNRWHRRFPHVFSCENTKRHERLYEETIRLAAQGKRVLELGCGSGENAARLLSLGAAFVQGIDVSGAMIAQARDREQPGRLEFANQDVSHPIAAEFDLIVGRSILHHIDYRPILSRLFAGTLRAGGTMVFMEPLGANPLLRLYALLVPRAHTRDERPFRLDDLRWFRMTFPEHELHAFNWASLPAGIVSSKVFRSADNPLMRAADVLDMRLAGRSMWLDAQFRHAVLVIRKTAA
ncbi:MAG TPA: class I SAM-dependent methyltransferase [Gemmatimonadaceae bacterium]